MSLDLSRDSLAPRLSGSAPLHKSALPSALVTVALCVGVWCGLPAKARADDDDAATAVRWQPEWRRINLFEGLALIPVGGLLWAIETQWTPPSQPNWQGGFFADDSARELLRGGTPELQRTAAKVSDLLLMGGVLVPIVIDVGVVTLGVHRKPDLAWQLFLIDLQSLFMAGLISLSAEHGVGRARPYVEDCGADGVVRDSRSQNFQTCGSTSENKSFFSGHASATATVAALTCIHYQHLPLYGGGFADLAPCLFTIAVSATTGMGRIIWSVGALSGYILPALIHYGWSHPNDRTGSQISVQPLATPFGGFGLSMTGKLD